MSDRAYGERRLTSDRFLPPDPNVREPYRLTPSLALRVGVLGAFALALFAVLFFRLWSLQVLSGEDYLNAAQNNQLRLVRVEAPRGPILDRDGRVVVSNVAGTAVQLWVGDMPRAEGRRREIIRGLSRILSVPAAELAREVASRELRPADADHRQDRRSRGAGQLPVRAPGRVPRGQDRPDVPARLHVPVACGADPRLRRRDLAGGAPAPAPRRVPGG